ncbi:MAG: D-alanyl-D-alanine carboxypeptidase [Leptolyngbya sp.]|nr:MAG: D-alanyl-D-alanine carboxypeptidase [Leptolyngbya sp.]
MPQSLNSAVDVLQTTPWLVNAANADSTTDALLQQYLKGLAGEGLPIEAQGVWLQSGPMVLSNNQGATPLPAASLTKIATTLVALETWGADHRFETVISTTGKVEQGVVNGDLVIQGGGDPLFVWEQAFAVGNALHKLGIAKVTGNLVIMGNFQMNFEVMPGKAGALLKEALNASTWSEDAIAQYQNLPPGTPRPQIEIAGAVRTISEGSLPQTQEVLRHQSLPLAQILKLMNVYSNNVIAQTLADLAGGAPIVAQKAAALSGVSAQEILLANGSGLGVENRISPRAVCAMLSAVQRYSLAHNLTIADLFPISGKNQGTIQDRSIPGGSVVKTGTLNDVSGLAGVMPTRDRGLIWFVIMNRGSDLEGLRTQQDKLLQGLTQQWGSVASVPLAIAPRRPIDPSSALSKLSDRNEVLLAPQ